MKDSLQGERNITIEDINLFFFLVVGGGGDFLGTGLCPCEFELAPFCLHLL